MGFENGEGPLPQPEANAIWRALAWESLGTPELDSLFECAYKCVFLFSPSAVACAVQLMSLQADDWMRDGWDN